MKPIIVYFSYTNNTKKDCKDLLNIFNRRQIQKNVFAFLLYSEVRTKNGR